MMVEEQIDVKVLAADFEMILAAHEGESRTEFEQEVADF